MTHIVIDIETTGFPQRLRRGYYPYSDIDKYASARIVSIAWVILDDTFDEIYSEYHVVKPDGFLISDKVAEIHGITQTIANDTGIAISKVIEALSRTFQRFPDLKCFIGHNIEFDSNILKSELYREGAYELLGSLKSLKEICTMRESCKFMVGGKYPKLSELYEICFRVPIKNAHNALHDAKNCAKCLGFLVLDGQLQI